MTQTSAVINQKWYKTIARFRANPIAFFYFYAIILDEKMGNVV
jgi:hypothetical protein